MKNFGIMGAIAAMMQGAGIAAPEYRKGSTPNKYKRHQGSQECARRKEQHPLGFFSSRSTYPILEARRDI